VSDRPLKVYVIQSRSERDYADCQAALDRVPAQLVSLPFISDPDEVIARARDADALIISSSPVTRRVMESLEGLKAVMRTGVGYDVIDVAAATELGVVVINVPDIWIRGRWTVAIRTVRVLDSAALISLAGKPPSERWEVADSCQVAEADYRTRPWRGQEFATSWKKFGTPSLRRPHQTFSWSHLNLFES